MINIDVPTIEGIKQEIAYSIDDFPYGALSEFEVIKYKNSKIYNVACAFDIETTTIEPKKVGDKYINNETPQAFMYQWQFCIHDIVVFGRTWESFLTLLDRLRESLELSASKMLVIYVHNLAYEFQFLKDFVNITSLFAKDKRKPIKFTIDGFEFRCSYFLSNMSLLKFCENSEGVIHYKLSDEYDYKKLRTPCSPMTNTELAYCYNDVRGLCECIESYMKYDTLATIPLTNTGFVRRDYRKAMKVNGKNWDMFSKTALTVDQYKMLVDAFRGANTHANRFFSNKIIDNVKSYDITSSYPSVMMMDYFPMTKFVDITLDNQTKLDYYCSNYCVVMEIEMYNVILKKSEVIPYIDIAHCKKRSKVVNDNGRVLRADYINITITEIDLDIIRRTYDYDGFIVLKAMYAKRYKLPIEFRKKLLDFYDAKTTLKGVEGKEYEYLKSKNRINASYGMTVTAIDHSEIAYNQNTMEWVEELPNIEEALESFYKNRNNFLPYQWGIYVTAHARRRLQVMLDKVGPDVVYLDTDSVKFVGEHDKDFEQVNNELIEIALSNDVKAYSEKDGKRYYLGVWDAECDKMVNKSYRRFKTLGAKKYCYEEEHKKGEIKFHITVSGMSKKLGAKEVGKIENFIIGKTFNNVGRTVSYYNEVKPHKITVNGDTFTTASNIGIVDTTYTLGVTNEYWELIKDNNFINLEDY